MGRSTSDTPPGNAEPARSGYARRRPEGRRGEQMEIENEFDVPAPIDHVWTYLLDVERVAPCMPGAELTEVIDDHTWKGKVNMKLGPVSLAFAGTVTMQERDDAGQAHRAGRQGDGAEGEGRRQRLGDELARAGRRRDEREDARRHPPDGYRGAAQPRATARGQPQAHAAVRRLPAPEHGGGRGRGHRVGGHRGCGHRRRSRPARAEPIGGIRLGLGAIWAAISRFFRRLFGKREA